jgi:two-component system, chemotaxis family, sensor kinase CheA
MSETQTNLVEQLKTFIDHLTELSDRIDPSDLGELAQIHEWALKIDELAKDYPHQAPDALCLLGRKIAETAENIILETYTDPKGHLTHLSQAVQELGLSLQAIQNIPEETVLNGCLAILEGTKEATDRPRADPGGDVGAESAESTPEAAPQPEAPAAADSDPEPAAPDYVQEPLTLSEPEFEYVRSFLTECHEHIENIESGILTVEQAPGNLDQINEVFRPFHTIKGMAGFLNLKDVQALTHEVETLLDLGRKGKLIITPSIIDVIFEALDVLKVQVHAIGEYMAAPTGKTVPQPPIAELIQRVRLAAKSKHAPGQPVAEKKDPGHKKLLGEILTEDAEVTPEVVEFALQQQQDQHPDKPVGTILTSMGAVRPQEVSKALRKQQEGVQETVVRVDTVKLDSLVNLVGELVIIQTQVEQNEALSQNPRLTRLVEQVSKITRDVQEVAMSMRMVPLAQTFHKMGRVLRDLARKVDKKVNYEVEGEETELDKNVIQELSDPLMHMIRNSVDHGIESPADRVKAGKPETGTVTLRAYHQGGNIVLEICDDGKGLDKDLLIRKGIEKGLISPDAQLTEQQAFNLILAPGFSTAEKVTDISGRGVGMDVVKRNIDKLRGKIDIKSAKGTGTTFTFRLPLTLAVIDGMIIRVGDQKFVLPTLSIVQSLSPTAEQIKTVQGSSQILNLRGQIYPLLCLGTMFNLPNASRSAVEGMVVITQAEDQQIGLILDELLGQQQVVIKSLGDRFKGVSGITGGAILGDGTIGLILEPAGLLDVYSRSSTV